MYAGADCTHVHDGNCGYVALVEAKPCQYVCAACDDGGKAPSGRGLSAELTGGEDPADPESLPQPPAAAAPSAEGASGGEETCTCNAAEGEAHADSCALYAAPADPVCTCGVAEGEAHTEDCDLYVAPVEPVCACETDDPAIHAVGCPLYAAPENPRCYCVEKCGVESQNFWCDICGFDVTACEGGEEEVDTTFEKIYTVTIEPCANGTVSADQDAYDEGGTVTLTVKADTGYVLDTLTVNNGAVRAEKVNDTTYTFTMPASAVTVSATFVACTDHVVGQNNKCSVCGVGLVAYVTADGKTVGYTDLQTAIDAAELLE